jgi:hypothetical protein
METTESGNQTRRNQDFFNDIQDLCTATELAFSAA